MLFTVLVWYCTCLAAGRQVAGYLEVLMQERYMEYFQMLNPKCFLHNWDHMIETQLLKLVNEHETHGVS